MADTVFNFTYPYSAIIKYIVTIIILNSYFCDLSEARTEPLEEQDSLVLEREGETKASSNRKVIPVLLESRISINPLKDTYWSKMVEK